MGCFTLGNTVLAEVERLLFNCIVVANISILSCTQEWLDALRVVAERE